MADFIHFEAEHSSDDIVQEEQETISDNDSFINDNSDSENEQEYGFRNVQVDLEQANREALTRDLEQIENCNNYSNLCADSDNDDVPLNEFGTSKYLIEEFKKELLPQVDDDEKNEHNEFIRVMLYAIRYLITNKTTVCNILDLKQIPLLDEIIEKFN